MFVHGYSQDHNMQFYNFNPTKLIHGGGALEKVVYEIPQQTTLAVIHSSTLGRYPNVRTFFAGINKCLRVDFYETNNQEPTQCAVNSLLGKLNQDTDLIIGVGGGSVMDTTKALAVCFGNKINACELKDISPMLLNKTTKFGLISTKPGSGAESNNAYVLKDDVDNFKRSYFSLYSYPQFSVQDPLFYESLSVNDFASGLTDAISHAIDQYLVQRDENLIQDSLTLSFLDIGRKLAQCMPTPSLDDYARLAWFGSMISSGLLSRGVKSSWLTHEVAHSVASVTSFGHGQTIAMVLTKTLSLDRNPIERLRSIALALGHESVSDKLSRTDAIDTIVGFFSELGMQTSFSEMNSEAYIEWCNEVEHLCPNLNKEEVAFICLRT